MKNRKMLSVFLLVVVMVAQGVLADRGRPHIDYSAGGTSNGTKVQLWDYYGNAAQTYTFTATISSGSSRRLDGRRQVNNRNPPALICRNYADQ